MPSVESNIGTICEVLDARRPLEIFSNIALEKLKKWDDSSSKGEGTNGIQINQLSIQKIIQAITGPNKDSPWYVDTSVEQLESGLSGSQLEEQMGKDWKNKANMV